MNAMCKKRVYGPGSYTGYPCSRKALRDGFCNQHHPDAAAKRREASDERRREQDARWRQEATEKKAAADRRDAIVKAAEAFIESQGNNDESIQWPGDLRRLRAAVRGDGGK